MVSKRFTYGRLIIVTALFYALALTTIGQTCTLRIGAFQGGVDGIVGMGDRPHAGDGIDGIVATAINKASQQRYESYEVDDLRYFEKLPEGRYRIVLSKAGFITNYERYELNCESDPLYVATWYYRMSPGNAKSIKDNDDPVKEMRLDRMTKLGSSDSDTGGDLTLQNKISGGDAINLPEPRLSAKAAAVEFSGYVKVRVFVNSNGKVVNATAISGHPLLLADCETAAYYSSFSPRSENGRAVSFFTLIKYPFGNVRTPKTVSGGILNGNAIYLPKPAYPPAARAVRAGGSVSVQVLIDEEGNVVSAKAVAGSYIDPTTMERKSVPHPLLISAAEFAARQARFSPTLLAGQPVKVSGIITYNFVP